MKLGLINSAFAQAGKGTRFGIEQTRKIGFDAVDIFTDPLDIDVRERKLIKETAAEWLDVHRTWHSMGCRSTCTMLYGHIETLAHRVDHLRQLRELQDETRGFTGFVPFAFEPSQSHGILADIKRASAFEQLRNLAVSRIFLDNIDHLTAYWVSLGLPLAQVSLSYGVDDLHGTILEEKIFHMAGATTPQQQTVAALEHAIREAGREPVQRDSYYRHISPRVPAQNTVTPAELACA